MAQIFSRTLQYGRQELRHMKRLLILYILLFAAISAAQDRIVFERKGESTTDIFLMNADGTWQRNLTNGLMGEMNEEPAISPDGKSMLFVTNRRVGIGAEIFVMDIASRSARLLPIPSFVLEHSPAWSPDGQMIAFSSCGNGFTNCDMYTARIDGIGGVTELANSAADDDRPRFSPDGSKVVFITNRNASGYEIYVCNSNGSNPQRLTTNNIDDLWPSWSPDGSQIIFSSLRDGEVSELYVMNADGSNPTRLTHNSQNSNYQPVFSTNGRRVAWETVFGANYQIVEAALENIDQPRRLTNNNVNDLVPDYGFITRKVSRFN